MLRVLGSGLAGTASPDLGLLVPSWTLGSVSPVVGFYGKVADLYKSLVIVFFLCFQSLYLKN